MFSSTEEALSFGLQASEEDREMLRRSRKMFLQDFDLAMEREAFDQASIFATKAQFCREALEAKDIVDDDPAIFTGVIYLKG
ncbi:hypothetical protein ES702_02183 [subsurface metagenome]